MEWSDLKFIGAYNLKLLTNSTIKIPDRFLKIYKRKQCKILKIIPWDNHSLALFPIEEWERKKKHEDIPREYIHMAYFIKRFFKISRNSEIKNGQIFIDNSLQSYAKIQKNIIIIGVCDYVEVWSKKTWDKWSKIYKDKTVEEMMHEIGLL